MASPICGWSSSAKRHSDTQQHQRGGPTAGRIVACRTIAPFSEQQQEGAAADCGAAKPTSKQPRRAAAAAAAQHARPQPQPRQQQQPAGGSTSRHAAACLASAEAAVSAATAALAVPPDVPAPAAAAAHGAAAGAAAAEQQQQQQQQQSLHSPWLAQARAQPDIEVSGSSAAPGGTMVSPCSSRLASPRGMHEQESSMVSLASSLHVGGLQQQQQQCNKAGVAAAAVPAAVSAAAAPQEALADAAPAPAGEQQAAALLAVQGISRRLRAQQHSRQGPAALQRQAPARPRCPPPPVTLNGALLLASCPGALASGDVQCADLSSRGISSIAPCNGGSADDGAAPVLSAFCELTRLQLSDNRLDCVAGLAVLPALQQLVVSANRLCSLAALAGQKQQLEAPLLEAPSAAPAAEADDGGSDAAGSEAAAGQAAAAGPAALSRAAGGFSQLQVLDVSFNAIPAEQLLGRASPLATLPSLRELHAAGSGLALLPASLGPFCSLTLLELSHNQLRAGPALLSLLSLPALQQLSLAHNPLSALPSPAAAACATEASPCCGRLLRLDLSHSRVGQVEQLLPLLQLAPLLQLLDLAHTPLAAQCALDRQPARHPLALGALLQLQRQRPGMQLIMQAQQQQGLRRRRGGSGSGQGRRPAGSRLLQPVTVEEAVAARHVLAAASRQAIASLPHELLVAAFARVSAGIDAWQLPPVPEDSSEWQQQAETRDDQQQAQQQQQQGLLQEQDEEPLVDNTFITGVGIVGQMPRHGSDAGDGEAVAAAAVPDASSSAWQDPTERLAVALGLQVTQLAHYTHHVPANPDGALHRLRHALAHPLVTDAAAGERPQQHHAALTAAAAGKQRPRKLLPQPQPIPLALDTRVVQPQAIDGLLRDMRGRLQELEDTLLQQLQQQAGQLSACAHEMSSSATAEARLLAAGEAGTPGVGSRAAQAIEAAAEA